MKKILQNDKPTENKYQIQFQQVIPVSFESYLKLYCQPKLRTCLNLFSFRQEPNVGRKAMIKQ